MVRAQNKYKSSYDRKIHNVEFKLGQWVLVRFPQEETGKQQKLARPWHGPYHVVEKRDPDLTVVSVYFPQKGRIQIHQSRVTPCPDNLRTCWILLVWWPSGWTRQTTKVGGEAVPGPR